VHQVVRRIEAIEDLVGLVEQPVVQHPHDVARVGRGRCVLDDQHAVEAALDLLAGTDVRVEPERARVLGRELVGEAAAGLDRRLRDVRDAVHRVRQAHAVPVDRRRLGQVVREANAQRLPQPDAQFGSGDAAVVGPDAQLAAVDQGELGRAGVDVERPDDAGGRRLLGQRAPQLVRHPRRRRFRLAPERDPDEEQEGQSRTGAGAHARANLADRGA